MASLEALSVVAGTTVQKSNVQIKTLNSGGAENARLELNGPKMQGWKMSE